jgi:dihydroxyacetone kinase
MRTMLDALVPAVSAFESGLFDKASVADALLGAAAAAEEGAEATAVMLPRAGRSAYVPVSATAGIPDPGAVACAGIIRGFTTGWLMTPSISD